MGKPARMELALANFSYDHLEPRVARTLRTTARRIRARIKKTMTDLIAIGTDLRAVKAALPHGQFGPWLHAEFGWGERMAQNFLSVAERFGPKSAILADLSIQPTAAYLLAAPSVSDAARAQAVARAAAGEQITAAVAHAIVAETKRPTRVRKPPLLATAQLSARLAKVLERYRQRWHAPELRLLARQLRAFAAAIDPPATAKSAR